MDLEKDEERRTLCRIEYIFNLLLINLEFIKLSAQNSYASLETLQQCVWMLHDCLCLYSHTLPLSIFLSVSIQDNIRVLVAKVVNQHFIVISFLFPLNLYPVNFRWSSIHTFATIQDYRHLPLNQRSSTRNLVTISELQFYKQSIHQHQSF